MNPIEQFHITKLVPLHLFGYDVSFTNSSLFMVISLALVVLVMIVGSSRRSLVPGRLQALAETLYEFIANMIRQTSGEAGMKFFPFVFSLFVFIFFANVLGLIPYSFTVTSHIIITVTMALMVFATVIIVGFAKNGLHFLRLFVPSGVPWWIMPFVVPIEVISFFTRPVSHSIRLFANMLAGHITLQVFAGFVVLLVGAGAAKTEFLPHDANPVHTSANFVLLLLAVLPFVFTVALLALELLVAALQAYVFTMLTCMYLNDALHPGQH